MSNVVSPKLVESISTYNTTKKGIKLDLDALNDRLCNEVAIRNRCIEAGISHEESELILVEIREKLKASTRDYNMVGKPDSNLVDYVERIDNAPIINAIDALSVSMSEKYMEIMALQEQIVALNDTRVGWNPVYPHWFVITRNFPQSFLDTLDQEKRLEAITSLINN